MQDELISRQAAVDALKQAYWNKDMQNAKDDPCIVDAMTDWAIRTIKDLPPVNSAEKQELCEDAVSREAVLMELGKYLCGVPFDEKGIDEVIKELPPVNLQPKTGHWIHERCDMYSCSACGHWHTDLSDEKLYMNYCPNCGAKMVKPQESEVSE